MEQAYLCVTCGVQDERQYVGAQGQEWTTLDELRRAHKNVLTPQEPGLVSIRTFMRSYPNYIPLSEAEAERVVAVLRPLAFDRLYGWTPERVVRTDAGRSVELSLARQGRALRGEHDVVGW
jgi:hypothetical protein